MNRCRRRFARERAEVGGRPRKPVREARARGELGEIERDRWRAARQVGVSGRREHAMDLGEARFEPVGRCIEDVGVDEVHSLTGDREQARIDQRDGAARGSSRPTARRRSARDEMNAVTERVGERAHVRVLANVHVQHDPLARQLGRHRADGSPQPPMTLSSRTRRGGGVGRPIGGEPATSGTGTQIPAARFRTPRIARVARGACEHRVAERQRAFAAWAPSQIGQRAEVVQPITRSGGVWARRAATERVE